MAQIISKDRVPYRIWDKINGVWNKLNFTTNAKSVDADDGKTLETKVGALNGITSDLSCEDESIAISAKAVNDSLSSLKTNLTDNLSNTGHVFRFAEDGEGNGGYLKADGSFTPFRNFSVLNDYKIIAIRAYDNNYTMNLSNTPDIIIVLPTGAYRTSNIDCNAEFGVIDKVGQSVIIGEVSYPTNKTTVTWTSDKVIDITRTNTNGGYTVIALKKSLK